MSGARYFFYDAHYGHWIGLSDGIILGSPRGNEKFAVDLQKSTNHLQILISGDTVRLVDLGSPLGTALNGEMIAPNTSSPLHVNDRVRINDRLLVLTLGETLPDQEPDGLRTTPKSPENKATAQPVPAPKPASASVDQAPAPKVFRIDSRGSPESARLSFNFDFGFNLDWLWWLIEFLLGLLKALWRFILGQLRVRPWVVFQASLVIVVLMLIARWAGYWPSEAYIPFQ